MNWLLFLIASLATFRIAHMLSSEQGPAAIFARLRRTAPAKSNVGKGLRCSACWSVHVAALITGYLFWLGLVPIEYSPLYVFALSGASVLLHRAQS